MDAPDYAGNNPVRYIDPDGRFFIVAIIGFISSYYRFNTTVKNIKKEKQEYIKKMSDYYYNLYANNSN